MSLKGLTTLDIRKAKTNIFAAKGSLPPIDYNKFVAAIEKHKPFFTWDEDTEQGRTYRKHIFETKGHLPDSYYKHCANCIQVKNKGYYRFSISYFEEWNKIKLTNTAQGGMTMQLLEIAFDIAELCDAKLYYCDTKFITKERIEIEKALILEKKVKKEK